VGVYYIVACHDCRVHSMLPKCDLFAAEQRHKLWTEKYHNDHDTALGSDYDEYFEAKIGGREVTGVGWYGLETKRVTERYKDIGFLDDKELEE
jgi:hypothetical protein